MKTKTAEIVLIVIGIIMITYTGFHFGAMEKVVDLGPIKISQQKNHFAQWSLIIGVVLLIRGIVIIALDKKARI